MDVCTGGAENGGWHFEPVMQALDAGKHVLVEKPLSNDIDEARQMVEFAAQRGLYLGCNLNHHFSEPADCAMDLVRDGNIGEQLYCLMRMGFQGGEYTYSGPENSPNGRGFSLLPRQGVPVAPVRDHAPLLRRHHPRAGVHEPARVPARRRRSNGVGEQHPHAVCLRRGGLPVQPAPAMRAWATAAGGASRLGGTRGSFAIENCVEKLIHFPGAGRRGRRRSGRHQTGQRAGADGAEHRRHRLRHHLSTPHPRVPGGRDQRRAGARACALPAATPWPRWSTRSPPSSRSRPAANWCVRSRCPP